MFAAYRSSRQVADLNDDEQAVALQALQLGVERVAMLGLLERVTVWAGRESSNWLLPTALSIPLAAVIATIATASALIAERSSQGPA